MRFLIFIFLSINMNICKASIKSFPSWFDIERMKADSIFNFFSEMYQTERNQKTFYRFADPKVTQKKDEAGVDYFVVDIYFDTTECKNRRAYSKWRPENCTKNKCEPSFSVVLECP